MVAEIQAELVVENVTRTFQRIKAGGAGATGSWKGEAEVAWDTTELDFFEPDFSTFLLLPKFSVALMLFVTLDCGIRQS